MLIKRSGIGVAKSLCSEKNAKTSCKFLRTGFRSSGRKQYSGSGSNYANDYGGAPIIN